MKQGSYGWVAVLYATYSIGLGSLVGRFAIGGIADRIGRMHSLAAAGVRLLRAPG